MQSEFQYEKVTYKDQKSFGNLRSIRKVNAMKIGDFLFHFSLPFLGVLLVPLIMKIWIMMNILALVHSLELTRNRKQRLETIKFEKLQINSKIGARST